MTLRKLGQLTERISITDFIYMRIWMGQPILQKEIRKWYPHFKKGRWARAGMLQKIRDRVKTDKLWLKNWHKQIKNDAMREKSLRVEKLLIECWANSMADEFDEHERSIKKDPSKEPMAKKKIYGRKGTIQKNAKRKFKPSNAGSLPVHLDGKTITKSSRIRHTCPRCRKITATTLAGLKEKFGVRKSTPKSKYVIPQSQCLKCRHRKKK